MTAILPPSTISLRTVAGTTTTTVEWNGMEGGVLNGWWRGGGITLSPFSSSSATFYEPLSRPKEEG